MEKQKMTIGQYLITRLYAMGIRHIFGIPGDYVIKFYKKIENSKIKLVGTTREDSAGFAADAYARMRGLGCVCVTYCVGGLNLTNPIAGAYAEKSPVVVISGAPGMRERQKNALLHHKVRDFTTQKEIFEKITVASTILDSPITAMAEIDRVLMAAIQYKRPVYIELPRDMVDAPCLPTQEHPKPRESSSKALFEAVAETVAMINASKRPVILAGVEIHRYNLQETLVELINKTQIPVCSSLLGKSVIRETHPLYCGIYEGALGKEEVTRLVENSDCLIMLGTFMTDIELGIFTAHLEQSRSINATAEKILVKYHSYEDVNFEDFMRALVHATIRRRPRPKLPRSQASNTPYAATKKKLTVERMFEGLNHYISDNMVVVSDIGDCLFGAADLVIKKKTEFLSPAYYTSMGFGMPAAIGAQLASPKSRILVLVGDGAFHMTGMEISTCVRLGLNPIVIVLNNHGYGTERHILEGRFNDVTEWNFSKIPEIFGVGKGYRVTTETEFIEALEKALKDRSTYSIVDAQLDKMDHSPAMRRLARRLAHVVQ